MAVVRGDSGGGNGYSCDVILVTVEMLAAMANITAIMRIGYVELERWLGVKSAHCLLQRTCVYSEHPCWSANNCLNSGSWGASALYWSPRAPACMCTDSLPTRVRRIKSKNYPLLKGHILGVR